MNTSELFQIGDVAKMFHISVGSLRHYERAGLLKPQYINPKTGYRYYGYSQFEALNTIRYLRVLDMPLNQIADFLQNKDVDTIEQKLLRQKEIVMQKQQELQKIERKIEHRLFQLRNAKTAQLDTIQMMEYPASRIVWMRDSIKPQSYLDLENPIRKLEAGQKESLAFLGKVGIGISKENLTTGCFESYDFIFLLLDNEDEYEGNISIFPAGKCVSIYFCGSHNESACRYEKLIKYIEENDLKIMDFSREITLIDYGITDDISKFVTEIRIPVI